MEGALARNSQIP